MAISPTTFVGSPDFLPSLGSPSAHGSLGEAFSRVLDRVLGNANVQQAQAEQSLLDLATGNADHYHGVLLNIAQSELSFRLILEIRNRLTDAYQEIMRMQV